MPFIAKHKLTGERVDISLLENPKLVLKSGDCVCAMCDVPMSIVSTALVTSHFRHFTTCTSDYTAHPESPEHLAGKLFIQSWLNKNLAEYSDAVFELEVQIPEVRRVADVMVTFPMGWRIAHEIQLSPITNEKLEERTNDYFKAGIDINWWLGGKADTYGNRDWCISNFGFYRSLKFEQTAYKNSLKERYFGVA